MNYFGMSDVGKIRKNNEDSFYVKAYDDSHMLAVVADGMGGYKGGKQASTIAVKSISEYIESLLPDLLTYNERRLKQAIIKALKIANKAIVDSADASDDLKNMGTTAVVCFICGEKLFAFNIGDSRLYIINDSITQITKDHSLVVELVEMGVISEKQAENHPQKNVITKALGSDDNIEPDIYKEKISLEDTILLCSDGLTNMLTDNRIIEIVNANKDIKKITKTLIEEAKKSGGRDNITVVTIRI